MSTFIYTALDAAGKPTSGTVQAPDRTAAMDSVLSKGLHPTSIEEHRQGAKVPQIAVAPAGKVSRKSVDAFTRELANLLAGGVSLSRSLHLLRKESSQSAAKAQWTVIHDDVVGGSSLADALAKWPRTFSSVYVAMVRAGEAGGFLDVVLGQIADFRENEESLKGKIKAALIYPILLALLAVGVLVFLMTYFIPRFADIFQEFGEKLPALTRVIVAISGMLMNYGLIVLGVVIAIVFIVRSMLTSDAGRRTMERWVLKTPALGQVVARFALVRFSRMLGTLIGSGVPLIASLRVAKEAIGNQTLADAVSHTIEQVQRGASLAKGLSSAPQLFPPSVIEMVTVAEETGRLDKELIRMATAYETELDRQLKMLVALAEPLMLFAMAAIIGTVVVGMLLPIFNLQDLIN